MFDNGLVIYTQDTIECLCLEGLEGLESLEVVLVQRLNPQPGDEQTTINDFFGKPHSQF